MNKIARSVVAALALVLVAGALSACMDTEGRNTSQRQADQASYDATAANRTAATASHK
jgi:hypothetical protein